LAEYLWNVYQKEGKYLVVALCKLCEAYVRLEKLPEAKIRVEEARKALENLTEEYEKFTNYVDAEEGVYWLGNKQEEEGFARLEELMHKFTEADEYDER